MSKTWSHNEVEIPKPGRGIVGDGEDERLTDVEVFKVVVVVVDLSEVHVGEGTGRPVVEVVVCHVVADVPEQLATPEGTEHRPGMISQRGGGGHSPREGVGIEEVEEANDEGGRRGREDQPVPVHRGFVVET